MWYTRIGPRLDWKEDCCRIPYPSARVRVAAGALAPIFSGKATMGRLIEGGRLPPRVFGACWTRLGKKADEGDGASAHRRPIDAHIEHHMATVVLLRHIQGTQRRSCAQEHGKCGESGKNAVVLLGS